MPHDIAPSPTLHPAPMENWLAREVTDKQLRGIRSLLNELHGYHQGPRPRLGAYVRCRRERGLVEGHSQNGIIFVTLDSGRRLRRRGDELTLDGAQRELLVVMLRRSADRLADDVDSVALLNLANHFRGDNGARYAHRAAYLWCVSALCHSNIAGESTWLLGRWLNREIQSGGSSESELPPVLDNDVLEMSNTNLRDGRFADKLKQRAQHAVARALELGSHLIELAESDDAQAIETDGLDRCLAIDLATERQVVVVGRSRLSQGAGFVQVIELDSLQSYVRHVSGLEIGDDAMDPGWFWDVITHSALKHPKSPAVIWLADNLVGPQGVDVEAPERRLVALLAALATARTSARSDSSLARRHLKRARELLRDIEKAERSRLSALAPELVAPEIRAIRFGSVDSLVPAMQSAIEAMLVVLPAPEPVPLADGPAVADSPDVARLPADHLDEHPALVAELEPLLPGPHAKIRFARPAKPLRFNITEWPLLAMEWQLLEQTGAHAEAVVTALAWLEQRLGTSLPKTWREGAHEIERAGVSVQIESAPKLFAFRLDHPDIEHPTRWWRVEATVIEGRGDIGGMVGMRMQVRDLVDLAAPEQTVPALVRAWSAKPGLQLAGARAGYLAHLRTDEELSRLDRILRRKGAQTPVVVTAAGGVRLPLQGPLAGLVRGIVVDRAVTGYAKRYGALDPDVVHVFAPGAFTPQSFPAHGSSWQEQLRLRALELRQNPLTPSFHDVRDAIHAHRAARPPTTQDRNGDTADIFPAMGAHIAQVGPANPGNQFNTDISEVQPDADSGGNRTLKIARDVVPSGEDIQQIVRRQVQDYEELLELAETERDQALTERDAAQSALMVLRHRVTQLTTRAAQSAEPGSNRTVVPETLAVLSDWVQSIGERVLFAEKAIRSAAKLEHDEVRKIYGCLQALHDLYWTMRFSDEDEERERAAEAWRRFLMHNRLTFSPVGTAARAGRYSDEYKATIGGKSYTATMHVAGSSAHDPLRCLRIYTDADEDLQRIVVIHLPTHLTNSLT